MSLPVISIQITGFPYITLRYLKEQYHGFSMILRGSKTYLDLRKPNYNNFISETITRQMITTHEEVRMADDGWDRNGLQNGFLKTVQNERFSDKCSCHMKFLQEIAFYHLAGVLSCYREYFLGF